MKELPILFALFLFVGGCGETAKTPEEVSIAYLKAVDNDDFKSAKAYCTENTRQLLEKLQMFKDAMGNSGQAETGKGKFEKATCEGTDDKKTCTVCCDKDGAEKPLVLVKQEGKWLVDMNKEDQKREEAPVTEEVGDTLQAPAEHGGGH
jgi:hypothetical protein